MGFKMEELSHTQRELYDRWWNIRERMIELKKSHVPGSTPYPLWISLAAQCEAAIHAFRLTFRKDAA